MNNNNDAVLAYQHTFIYSPPPPVALAAPAPLAPVQLPPRETQVGYIIGPDGKIVDAMIWSEPAGPPQRLSVIGWNNAR